MPVSESWTRRLVIWVVLVWIAVALGGGVAGAAWGLAGFDCDGGPGRLEVDSPCPIAPEPTISQHVSYVVAGGIRLGLAAAAVGYLPALVFTVSAGVLGWALSRVSLARLARWAPWITLGVGAGGSVVWLIRFKMVTASWAWAGLFVAVVITAIGIDRADRPGPGLFPGPNPHPPRTPDPG